MNEAEGDSLLRYGIGQGGVVDVLHQVPEIWSAPLFRSPAHRKRQDQRHEESRTNRETMQEPRRFFRWRNLRQWRYWKLYGWYCTQYARIVIVYRVRRIWIESYYDCRWFVMGTTIQTLKGVNRFLDWLAGK